MSEKITARELVEIKDQVKHAHYFPELCVWGQDYRDTVPVLIAALERAVFVMRDFAAGHVDDRGGKPCDCDVCLFLKEFDHAG